MFHAEMPSKYQTLFHNRTKHTVTNYNFAKGPEGHNYDAPQKAGRVSIIASVIGPCN